MRNFYRALLSLVCFLLVAAAAFGNDSKYKTTKILYTTIDGKVLNVENDFHSFVLSNTYENGQGVLVLDGVFRRFMAPFEDNSQLTSLVIPEGTTSLGRFENCDHLEVLIIPEGARVSFFYARFPALKEFRSPSATADGRCLIEDGVLCGFAPAGISSYTIPEGVTRIASGVFNDDTEIRRIVLPDSIEEIDENAFDGCSSLKSFVSRFATPDGRCLIKDGKLLGFAPAGVTSYSIPDGVTTLGAEFAGCQKLTEITLPSSLEDLGRGPAFRNCPRLARVTLLGKLKQLQYNYFENCPNLREFVSPQATPDGRCLVQDGDIFIFAPAGLSSYSIPEGITAIVSNVFSGLTGLKSVTCPESLLEIGWNAFEECTGLTSITLPKGLEEIGGSTFKGCSGLTSITFPEGLREIGWSAFEGCSALSELSFPSTLRIIEVNAFKDCTSLTKINLPDGFTQLSGGAFEGCTSLKEAILPKSITSIEGSQHFNGCTSLERVVIPGKEYKGSFENCPSLRAFVSPSASADGRCFIVNGKLIGFAPAGLRSYSVPEGVTTIAGNAFAFYKELEHISLPESIRTIEGYAFLDCEALQDVVIPVRDIEVGANAFQGCHNLRHFDSPAASADGRALVQGRVLVAFAPAGLHTYTIPEEITFIGEYSFKGSRLEELVIPPHVKSIGEGAFCWAKNMMVRMESLLPPSFGHDAFLFCENVKLFVPKESISYYAEKLDRGFTALHLAESILVIAQMHFTPNAMKMTRWSDYVDIWALVQ